MRFLSVEPLPSGGSSPADLRPVRYPMTRLRPDQATAVPSRPLPIPRSAGASVNLRSRHRLRGATARLPMGSRRRRGEPASDVARRSGDENCRPPFRAARSPRRRTRLSGEGPRGQSRGGLASFAPPAGALPSSSGLGRSPLKAETRVRFPLGAPRSAKGRRCPTSYSRSWTASSADSIPNCTTSQRSR